MTDIDPVPRRAECALCLRAQSACVCGFAARIDTALDLLILQHPMEVRNAKGTARLLHLSVSNSAIAVGETFDADALRNLLYAGARTPVLLYPPSELGTLPAGDRPPIFSPARPMTEHPHQPDASSVRLVVLDGTWRKSRKMLFCNPLLQSLPRLSLDDVPPSAYRIRKAHAPHQLSTLEATACAIAALDPSANIEPLLNGFEAFINQQAAFAGR